MGRVDFLKRAGKSFYVNPRVKYPCTNESISAAVIGLMPEEKDVMICVAGSGDISFALAPFVNKIYAVDRNVDQLKFMKEQMEFLSDGDFEGFCRSKFMALNERGDEDSKIPGCDILMKHLIARKDYFEQRFFETRRSLSKIEVVDSDVLDFVGSLDDDSVDKVYLSNILDWMDDMSDGIGRVAGKVRVGGKIYDTTMRDRDIDMFCSGRLTVNTPATLKARKAQGKSTGIVYGWEPSVYERVM